MHKIFNRTTRNMSHKSSESFSSIPLKWVELPKFALNPITPTPLRLMSYNILAESNIRQDMYPKCTKYDLEWKRRFPVLLQ